jgi:hypothetical protein
MAPRADNPRDGAVITAFGKPYVDLAFQAARSLRATNPGLPVDLFTEAPVDPGPFDRVHVLRDVWIRSKIDAMRESRFERTLYLDADLMVLADLGDVFEVLDRFDFALCHDQNRNSILGRREYRIPLPNAYPQFNGGVVGFRRSPQTLDFIDNWKVAIQDHGIRKDQPSLRELLWQSSLRVATLPPEYNLWDLALIDVMRPKHHAAPRIIHSNLFVQKPLPPAGKDILSHYIGPARARKVRIMLRADETLAHRSGRVARLPSRWQNLWLRGLYLLEPARSR